jgi:hypothetical protein
MTIGLKAYIRGALMINFERLCFDKKKASSDFKNDDSEIQVTQND